MNKVSSGPLRLAFATLAAGLASVIGTAARAQQVGLESADVVDELKITDNGVEYSVVAMRDARQRSQWYYVPRAPHIVLVKDGDTGKLAPEMALVKFQFPNPATPGQLIEGGLAQFSLEYSIPPEALPAIRSELSKRTGIPTDQITIAPMPFTAANVAIYDGSNKTLISNTPSGEGAAPTFATQKVSFQVPLTKAGVDVYEALINGNTGFGVRAEYDYQGLTPPLGFDVDVDWDQTFAHLSKDEKIRVQVSARALFGLYNANASYNKQNTTIRESLEQHQCIKVNIIAGSGFTMDQVDKYLQPLLARISQEMLEATKPPPQIAPAAAADPGTGNYGISGGYSVAVKDVKLAKKGKETISFGVRTVVDRKAIIEGFVGITQFDAETKKKIVRTIAPGQWQAAYFPFPDIGRGQELGLTGAGVEVALVANGQVTEQQAATWAPTDGWKQVGRAEAVKYFTFPLAAAMAKLGDTGWGNLKFKVHYTLNTSNGPVLETTQELPATNAATLIPPALNSFSEIQVSPASLNWVNIDPNGAVRSMEATLSVDGEEFTIAISPSNNNGAWLPPKSANFIVPADAKKTALALTMISADGSLLRWKYDGTDLRNLSKQDTIPGVTRRLVAPRRDQFVD